MYRAIGTAFRKMASLFIGSGVLNPVSVVHRPAGSVRVATMRGRRKDSATFTAIGALLALFFLGEFVWVIAHQLRP
jgi:hypothetical protein